ncbi:aspergillopepsin [Phanerochaete sordida]|uniref:Aspergillopepsin n=1 Tax=Phanerochaete sordida TaxID=48140 RepID=A0A9P3G5H5_9APHY|nr:aspergillopepsin [Phanerochaete sordida]
MLLSTILVQALLAAVGLALPSGKTRLDNRVTRRASGAHTFRTIASNSTHASYSPSWSGVVLHAPAGTWRSVTGTFVVPAPKVPTGGSASGTYAASAWVGIDGDTCTTAILQTGVDFYVESGTVSYDGWYEWYPDYAYDFAGLTFSAGDSVTLTVTALSKTSGTATITNNSKGKTVTKQITSTAALCEQDAEWIVESFDDGSSLVPVANFGTITFTNAYATTNNGTIVYPSSGNPTLYDIEQSGKVLTSASTSGSSVTVSYV